MHAYWHSWVRLGPWRHTHECSWLLMSSCECSKVPISTNQCSWVFIAPCSVLLMSIHEFSWALIITHEHSWAWFYGAMAPTVLMSIHEFDTMAPWPIIVSWHNTYQSMLMRNYKCSLVLLSDPEYSWVILSVQVLDSVMNETCWFLQWLPFSILAISWSKFHQIIKNLIDLKSTWKVLLKNVQDRTSTGFGGREINKRKVETILRDTL